MGDEAAAAMETYVHKRAGEKAVADTINAKRLSMISFELLSKLVTDSAAAICKRFARFWYELPIVARTMER